MERIKYPFNHNWHAAINQHSDKLRKASQTWPHFMYEAKTLADELPRMVKLFASERAGKLPAYHQQCSRQRPELIEENKLVCCRGVVCSECSHLMAIDSSEHISDEDKDTAKAFTCATHIVSDGGDVMREGYILTKGDRLFWDNVYQSMAGEQ